MKFLATSDWHLQHTRPRCRVDDWYQTMRSRLQWMTGLINEYQCPILVAGDIFDSGTNTMELENMTISELKKAEYPIITIAGNHDLAYRSLKQIKKSSYWVLAQTNIIQHLFGGHTIDGIGSVFGKSFGEEWESPVNVFMTHASVYPTSNIPFFMPDALSAEEMLNRFPDCEVVITGDIHESFYFQKDGRTLINGGGIIRLEADKKYTVPTVYLYEDGVVTPFPAPIVIDNVVQEYLIEEKARDTRISAFVEKLSTSAEIGLSFKDNVELGFRTNKVRPVVKELVLRAMEDSLCDLE